MKKFLKNIYLKNLEKNLRTLEEKKANALKKSANFKKKSNNLISSLLTHKVLKEIADNNYKAVAYIKVAKSYEEDIKKIAEKIAKLKA